MRITVKENTISKTLKALGQSIELPKIKRRLGVIGLADVLRNFKEGGRPDKWKALAGSTLVTKALRGGRSSLSPMPLQDSRVLVNGIHFEDLTPMKFAISTSDEASRYAAIQHKGGTTHPRVTAKMIGFFWWKYKQSGFKTFKSIALTKLSTLTVKIPARPYMLITADGFAEMGRTAKKIVAEITSGKGAD